MPYVIPQKRGSQLFQDRTHSNVEQQSPRLSTSLAPLAPVVIDTAAEERLHDDPPFLGQPFVFPATSNVPSNGQACYGEALAHCESCPRADAMLDVLIAEFANAEAVFMSKLNSTHILEAPHPPMIGVFVENELVDTQLHRRMPSSALDVIRNGVPRSRENSKGSTLITRGRENSRGGGTMGRENVKLYVEGINGLRRELEVKNERKSRDAKTMHERVTGQQAWNVDGR